jgi:hypothetical protein
VLKLESPRGRARSEANAKLLVCYVVNRFEESVVTCYFRHLQKVFSRAGIVVTAENRRELDKTIHGLVGVKYKDCPAVWKEVKKRLAEDEDGFVVTLKNARKKRLDLAG